jgi:hypothetical protein
VAKLAALTWLAVPLALGWGGGGRWTRQFAQTPLDMGAMDSTDRRAVDAAHAAMSGPMAADPHMVLTPPRPAAAADSARAAALVAQMRVVLAKYRDVRVARADGFRQFLPGVRQPVYHFTNWRWALEEMFRFNPAKPTSLLYRGNRDGTFTLVGAMYAAPARASLDELDQRVPLSITHWHQHVNWCVPSDGARERWRETRDGRPLYGPRSPIATAAACEAVGGRFRPRVFGWMVHVMAFASADPRVIWGGGHEPHS